MRNDTTRLVALAIGLLAFGLAGCPSGTTPPARDTGPGPGTDTGPGSDGGSDAGGGGCGSGRTSCGGACVDTDTDVENCGSCDNACGATEECNDGTCEAVSCTGGLTACGAGCTDTNTDRTNCGACGTACDATETCTGGSCVPSCAAPNMLCTEDPGDGTTVMVCRMVQSDPLNCGACGTACNADQTCVAGDCVCAAGRTECGGVCVSTDGDPSNCGGCGTVCSADQNCVAGDCECPAGRTECGGACVNTAIDNDNCGGCGTVCGAGTACGSGTCTSVCAGSPGTTPCGGSCVNTSTDRNNCGGCGIVCASNANCAGSACVPTNDLRTGAIAITVPTTLAAQTVVTGSNANATSDSLANVCGCSNLRSIWYSFTVPAGGGIIYFDTFGTTWDASLAIASSTGAIVTSPNPGGGYFCNDDSGCADANRASQVAGYLAAGNYYVVVDGCGSGDFTLNMQFLPRNAVGFLYTTPISGSGTNVNALNVGTSQLVAMCTGVGASTEEARWFTTCSATPTHTFSLCAPDGGSWTRGANNMDPELYLWSGFSGTQVACNDDGGFGCGATDAASSNYGPRLAGVTAGRGLNAIIVDERNNAMGLSYTIFYNVTR